MSHCEVCGTQTPDGVAVCSDICFIKNLGLVDICYRCRYWFPEYDDSRLGTCHRRSPRVPYQGGDRWPPVDASEWCGDYKKKWED